MSSSAGEELLKGEDNFSIQSSEEKVTEITSSNDQKVDVEPALSKNQRKRLLKAQIWEKAKRAKKERRKEEKKKVVRIARPATAAALVSTNSSAEDNVSAELHESRKERKQNEKREFEESCKKNFTVIIDLAWEEKHQERALKSLKQQVMYCYGFNKRHTIPAWIHLTGIGPKLRSQMVNQTRADNWIGFTISDEEYVDLPAMYSIKRDEAVERGEKKELVYLSSDAEETLDKLDDNCAYIIGGIVDRNKYKGITHAKAVSQGIRTAKLPIRENYQLSATHVLTVNHVFEILLNFKETGGNWKAALETVLPKRKEPKAKNETTAVAGDGDDDDVDGDRDGAEDASDEGSEEEDIKDVNDDGDDAGDDEREDK